MLVEKIDTWIRDKFFEPVSQAIQVRTGHTCYYVAWWCVGGAFLSQCLFMSSWIRLVFETGGIQPEWAAAFWISVVVFPCFLINCVADLYKLQKLWERSSWQNAALGESRTAIMTYYRMLTASMFLVSFLGFGVLAVLSETSVITTRHVALIGTWFLAMCTEYFASCTPLPPSASRKETAEGFRTNAA
jgi:hypothetical protein